MVLQDEAQITLKSERKIVSSDSSINIKLKMLFSSVYLINSTVQIYNNNNNI